MTAAAAALAALLAFLAITMRNQGERSSGGSWTWAGTANVYAVWQTIGDRRRVVIFPQYLNARPLQQAAAAGRANVPNPAVGRFVWSDGGYDYGGTLIRFPAGRDLAIVGPDGSVTFLPLKPAYVPRNPGAAPVDLEALAADGVLPPWAAYADDEGSDRPRRDEASLQK
ncbi:MAG TPA: hypothetical protein VK324_09965 [Tepidisphaeraceae bacterium]|nr:hypothetical protein [Tepidisphaeraceae bacterium]